MAKFEVHMEDEHAALVFLALFLLGKGRHSNDKIIEATDYFCRVRLSKSEAVAALSKLSRSHLVDCKDARYLIPASRYKGFEIFKKHKERFRAVKAYLKYSDAGLNS